ncbi:MAG: class I SAM-dependent methyltransferase [Sandaracinus sp.]
MSDERTRRYYDDFATTYEGGRDRGYHALVDDIEASLVIPHARGKRVLEVGCGTGLVLARIAPVAERAVGVDLSPGMLAKARERGLEVHEGSATALPFEAESFDVVCSFKVLAHVPDLPQALREVSRVLRPGGIALLELYNRRSLRYLARRIAGARRIGSSHRESDISTRWDTTDSIRRALPPELELERFAGVRIVTPAAVLHAIPGVRALLGKAERVLAEGPLAEWGGFLVAVAKKR